MKSKGITSLISSIFKPPDDKKLSTQIFSDIDIERVALNLELESEGSDRGKQDLPKSSSNSYDVIELKIIERMESELKESHALYEDQLLMYSERLANLEFEQRVTQIRQTIPDSVGDFKMEIKNGLNEFQGPLEDVKVAHDERENFRIENGLNRAPKEDSPARNFFKWAVILALLVVETILNGQLLSNENARGFIGGIFEAFVFASLNIGFAFLLGRLPIPQINHVSIWRKLIGITFLEIYIVFVITINLALAHYRDSTLTFEDGGGELVLQKLQTAPLQLNDLMSWLLFGVGAIFSIVACLDGFYWSDVYPGYADVQKRLTKKRDAFINISREIMAVFREIRDEYSEKINDIGQDLALRRSEYDKIIANQQRMANLFARHQNQIENATNALLGMYHDANISTRQTKVPAYFSKSLNLIK